MSTQVECGKKEEPLQSAKRTKYKVVTRSPYNLRKQSQDDMNTHSLRTSLELEGICKNKNDPELPDYKK